MAAKKQQHRDIEITINPKLCKGCGICVAFCPKKVLKMSEKMNEKGFHLCEVVSLKDCIACRNCELFCPDMAISVKKKEK